MNQTELQKTLALLRTELGTATEIDDETRALLAALAQEIQRISDQSTDNATDEVEPVTEKLQELVLKFETDHPQLTSVLNQVSAALANLGI